MRPQLATFDQATARAVAPLMILFLLNTVSGLGGTQRISLPVRPPAFCNGMQADRQYASRQTGALLPPGLSTSSGGWTAFVLHNSSVFAVASSRAWIDCFVIRFVLISRSIGLIGAGEQSSGAREENYACTP